MIIIYFLIGSIIGSFLCVVAERIPQGKSIVSPASHCIHCKQKLSMVYFVSEFISGCLLSSLLLLPIESVNYFLLFSAFTLSLTDFFYLTVEPKIFFPSAFFLCLQQVLLEKPFHLFFCCFLICLFIFLTYFFPEALGGGDMLILLLWGVLLGSKLLLLILLTASTLGLIFIYLIRWISHKTIKHLPFLPFLSISLYLVLLYQAFHYL